MEIDELFSQLQNTLSDGLVTIVGSGLSAAYGLPGMPALAGTLQAKVPPRLAGTALDQWKNISNQLDEGKDLEGCLEGIDPNSPIVPVIREITSNAITEKETEVIAKAIAGTTQLAFSDLVRRLPFPNNKHEVITTNYDRLLEVSIELAEIGIDCSFCGSFLAPFDPERSKERFSSHISRQQTRGQPRFRKVYHKRVSVIKPHGSLDWHPLNGKPHRVAYQTGTPPLIITPGGSKYRAGYESPFDHHIAEANRAIDAASAFLIIGYGFNDDHLETHLRARLKEGRPGILLTRGLTPNSEAVISESPNLTAISAKTPDDLGSTKVNTASIKHEFDGIEFWSLEGFNKNVLKL
ncbi:SIR2 family protein [Verrucomicrobiaceae bacterium 227]